jgi:hypothetical protein
MCVHLGVVVCSPHVINAELHFKRATHFNTEYLNSLADLNRQEVFCLLVSVI